jgi:hypothetical protein
MKKEKGFYNNFRIYEDRDTNVRNWKSKIVVTRKTHHCCMCDTDIPIGSEALCETCIDPDRGHCSSYTCGACVDKHI